MKKRRVVWNQTQTLKTKGKTPKNSSLSFSGSHSHCYSEIEFYLSLREALMSGTKKKNLKWSGVKKKRGRETGEKRNAIL